MRFICCVALCFIAATTCLAADPSPEDLNFLKSLGSRYRFGLEIEVTREELSSVASYYEVEGDSGMQILKKIVANPERAAVRADAPEEVRKILSLFIMKKERGLPEIEFALRDDVTDDVKRNPLVFLEIESRLAELLHISGILADPFGPYTGVSVHMHMSRNSENGAPEPFQMERILAQFDYKAAKIYEQNAEDMFMARGLAIFLAPEIGRAVHVRLRDGVNDPYYFLFKQQHTFNRNLITNLRGQTRENLIRVANESQLSPEDFPTSNWIEDKGRIFVPAQQLIWTLKILEGEISLEDIYDPVALMIMQNDFLSHVLDQLHYPRARNGMAMGLVLRTARYSRYRAELTAAMAEAIRAAQRDERLYSARMRAFVQSASSKIDKEFVFNSLEQALGERASQACETAISEIGSFAR